MKVNKICLVTSRGGHLYQLYALKPWWQQYNRFWIVVPGEDTKFFLRKEQKYPAFYPESRHFWNALQNFVLGLHLLRKEQPNLVVSIGAGVGPPVLFAAKLLGIKTLFIEPYDFIRYPSWAGKMASFFVNQMIVQHQDQLHLYKQAKVIGPLV